MEEALQMYFNYGEIISCKTEAELKTMFDRITQGFSGIPSASVVFNHALNQKQAIDWLINTAKCYKVYGETLDKAIDYRKGLVEMLKASLE